MLNINKYFGRERQVAELLNKFGPYKKLLDLGCFDGKTTFTYSSFAKTTYGVDPDIKAIQRAKLYKKLHFRKGKAEKLPFPSNFFNCVVFSDVLEHVIDDQKSMNEIYRVLTRNGVLILTTPHRGMFSFLDPLNYGYYLKKLLLIKNKKQFHRHYSLAEIKKLASNAGFNKSSSFLLVKRVGFLFSPLIFNFELILKKLGLIRIMKPLVIFGKKSLGEFEFKKDFGKRGYYLAAVIKKIN